MKTYFFDSVAKHDAGARVVKSHLSVQLEHGANTIVRGAANWLNTHSAKQTFMKMRDSMNSPKGMKREFILLRQLTTKTLRRIQRCSHLVR